MPPKLTDTQAAVLAAIPRGKANVKIADEIALAAGVDDPDSRTQVRTRQTITELIELGFPIVSNSRGYWITDGAAEVWAYIETLEGRIRGVQCRISALRRTAEALLDGNSTFGESLTGDD